MDFPSGNFISIPIERELNDIFQMVKLSPSAFNLQHTKYLTVLDPVMEEKVWEAANGQYKVHSFSGVILVLGVKLAYQQAADL